MRHSLRHKDHISVSALVLAFVYLPPKYFLGAQFAKNVTPFLILPILSSADNTHFHGPSEKCVSCWIVEMAIAAIVLLLHQKLLTCRCWSVYETTMHAELQKLNLTKANGFA